MFAEFIKRCLFEIFINTDVAALTGTCLVLLHYSILYRIVYTLCKMFKQWLCEMWDCSKLDY
jgi:hypothetical protein